MTGEAAPSGTGGGAKHIALGINSPTFPINSFLNITTCQDINIKIEKIPGLIREKTIEFSCNPSRRHGEWRISRQHSDRYPLWTTDYSFPRDINEYNEQDPPIIFIIRISKMYHARFCMYSDLDTLLPSLKIVVDNSRKNSGIERFRREMGEIFKIYIPPPEHLRRIPEPSVEQPLPPEELPAPPQRTSSVISRYIRESRYGKELKELYEYRCCFCEKIIERPFDNPYVESCHIQSLNEDGPDVKENILILCPNHHIEVDYGTITINPKNLMLIHIDEKNELHGKKIKLRHKVNSEYLEFHFNKWSARALMGY